MASSSSGAAPRPCWPWSTRSERRKRSAPCLGQGVKRAAEKLGGDSWKFAVHVKGMETPMHDPRTFFSMGLTYAVGPRGACHLHGHSPLYEGVKDPMPEWGLKGEYSLFESKGKGLVVKLAQDHTAVVNSMVSCYFLTFILKPSDMAAVLTAATGTKYTARQPPEGGERIMALHRAYNNLCGITRKDDVLAPRALRQPRKAAMPARFRIWRPCSRNSTKRAAGPQAANLPARPSNPSDSKMWPAIFTGRSRNPRRPRGNWKARPLLPPNNSPHFFHPVRGDSRIAPSFCLQIPLTSLPFKKAPRKKPCAIGDRRKPRLAILAPFPPGSA